MTGRGTKSAARTSTTRDRTTASPGPSAVKEPSDDALFHSAGAQSGARALLPSGEGRLGQDPQDRDQHHTPGPQAAFLPGAEPAQPSARAGAGRWNGAN